MRSIVHKKFPIVSQDEQGAPSGEAIKEQIQAILASLSSKLAVENGKVPKANTVPQDQEDIEKGDEAQSTMRKALFLNKALNRFGKLGAITAW